MKVDKKSLNDRSKSQSPLQSCRSEWRWVKLSGTSIHWGYADA
jgi:hypothetical protein